MRHHNAVFQSPGEAKTTCIPTMRPWTKSGCANGDASIFAGRTLFGIKIKLRKCYFELRGFIFSIQKNAGAAEGKRDDNCHFMFFHPEKLSRGVRKTPKPFVTLCADKFNFSTWSFWRAPMRSARKKNSQAPHHKEYFSNLFFEITLFQYWDLRDPK